MKKDSVSSMLFDVSRELIEMAKAAKARAAKSGNDYDKGRQMGLYQAVSLLQQQADAFQIERADLGLDSVDPERDLLQRSPSSDTLSLAAILFDIVPSARVPL